MPRSPDILFMAEYIKNVLYFATVRQGKTLKNTGDTHYFCIDNELVYENYYSDFGPLNLGCVYKYCKLLNDKLKQYLNKQIIVHYTSIDPRKKANSAFLLGSYGVLYLSLQPRDALKPLTVHGQSYRPFQDATQGDSSFTISLMDCLQAIQKARELGFFNFQDFNYEEYERLDKIQGGDLNWIIPGKFLAFIGPVDYSVSLYHPPEMYIDYFLENNVKIVIRLNKRLYDGNVFNNVGIVHYDLFFPDGSCPPRHILLKFLQISEESDCAIAVHCKAGLGRTGSLIGCYLMKHYRMTSHEAIGWMRICRPGSVIGHQQGWLEQLEAWLLKQGNFYRKRTYNDIEKLPYHEFGLYSIAEKTTKQRPVAFHKVPSPSPTMNRLVRSDIVAPARPQASNVGRTAHKTEKGQPDWCVRSARMSSPKINQVKGKDSNDTNNSHALRQGSGVSEPRVPRSHSRNSTSRSSMTQMEKNSTISNKSNSNNVNAFQPAITTFRSTNGPMIKNVNDARNFLLRSSKYSEERERQLLSAVKVTPHTYSSSHTSNLYHCPPHKTVPHVIPSSYSTATRGSTQPAQRRRLGRSPSPPQSRMSMEHTRATNTSPPSSTLKEKYLVRDSSKSGLREALSRLKLAIPRDGSIGAASLEARRDAPAPNRAPSVRSDERPLATQGDLLNSIKFQKRLRDSLHTDKFHDKLCPITSKDRSNIKKVNSKTTTATRLGSNQSYSMPRENPLPTSRNLFGPTRPSSPKGRRSPHSPPNY